jgi:hypothetical protein
MDLAWVDLTQFPQVDAIFKAVQATGSWVIQAHLEFENYSFAGGHTEPVSRLNLVLSLPRAKQEPKSVRATPYYRQRQRFDYRNRASEEYARPTRLYPHKLY